jgi:type IX secretion system PorP/SprF family membrane protein
MVRLVLTIVFFIVFVVKSMAQDPVFTQNFLVPETLNSAFTGLSESNSAGLLHRSQWPNLNLQIDSEFAFINTWNEKINSGIGLSVINQRQNFTNYNFTKVDINYAYKVQLTDEWVFHPSLSVGYANRVFNSNNISFEDQIDILNGVVNQNTLEPSVVNEKINYFDFSTGMLLNNEDFFIGTSLKHLNKPNVSVLSNGNAPLDMFFSVNLGYQFTIADYVDIISFPFETKLRLTSNYIKQGSFRRIDLGGALVYSNYFFGLSANSNLQGFSGGSTTFNSFSLFGGLNYEHLQFGYSYDFNTLKGLNTGGVYELSVLYRFDLYSKCYTCPNN